VYTLFWMRIARALPSVRYSLRPRQQKFKNPLITPVLLHPRNPGRVNTMSTDEDYSSFLDKANQDTGSSKPAAKKDDKFAQTKAVDTDVPGPLKSLDAFYTSDTDEPFEPVALAHSGKLDEKTFGKLIGHNSEIESTDLKSWNVNGQYDEVVNAVKKAGGDKSDVKVFRVAHGTTRCEYYIVALVKDGKVVGVKAKAVES